MGEPGAPSVPRTTFSLGRRGQFHVQPLEQRDLPVLHSLLSHPPTGLNWRYRGGVPSIEAFAGALFTDAPIPQLTVRDSATGKPVGLINVYQQSLRDRHCYVGALIDPAHQRSGLGIISIAIAIDYVLFGWDILKIYIEIPGYSQQRPRFLTDHFVHEATLREHMFYGGSMWDMNIYSISRRDWPELYQRLSWLTPESEAADVARG